MDILYKLIDGELVRAESGEANSYPRGDVVRPPQTEDGYRPIRQWKIVNGKFVEDWVVEKEPTQTQEDLENEQNKETIKNADISDINNMTDFDKDSLLVSCIKVIKSIF